MAVPVLNVITWSTVIVDNSVVMFYFSCAVGCCCADTKTRQLLCGLLLVCSWLWKGFDDSCTDCWKVKLVCYVWKTILTWRVKLCFWLLWSLWGSAQHGAHSAHRKLKLCCSGYCLFLLEVWQLRCPFHNYESWWRYLCYILLPWCELLDFAINKGW